MSSSSSGLVDFNSRLKESLCKRRRAQPLFFLALDARDSRGETCSNDIEKIVVDFGGLLVLVCLRMLLISLILLEIVFL